MEHKPPPLFRIRNWQRDADEEDADREYFMHLPIVEGIKSGKVTYVVGRKGTGKTAIQQHVERAAVNEDYSAVSLTLTDFPHERLYKMADADRQPPNQYRAIWYYFILCNVVRMMSKGNLILDSDARKMARALFDTEDLTLLSDQLTLFTGSKFNIGIPGFLGMGRQQDGSTMINNTPISDRIKIIETFIERNINDRKYFVQFDELDEDYRGIVNADKDSRYADLLVGLMMASRSARKFSRRIGKNIFPVVYLRDDIMSQIGLHASGFAQRWGDRKKEIIWNKSKLKALIAHRISKDLECETLPFKEAWAKISLNERCPINRGKTVSDFDYIFEKTHSRPRDIIVFLAAIAERGLERHLSHIGVDEILDAEPNYSVDFRMGLEDEIKGVMPEIHKVIECFAKLRRKRFSMKDFSDVFDSEFKGENISVKGAEGALMILHSFSIVGSKVGKTQENQGKHEYKFQRPAASLNTRSTMQLHRGLYGSLSL